MYFQDEQQVSFISVTNPNPCRVHVWRGSECLHTLEPHDTLTMPLFHGLRVSASSKRAVLVFEHVGFEPWMQRIGQSPSEPNEAMAIKTLAEKNKPQSK